MISYNAQLGANSWWTGQDGSKGVNFMFIMSLKQQGPGDTLVRTTKSEEQHPRF